MATSNTIKVKDSETSFGEDLECAVCLQTCIHPVKLPCSHIFCFLCVKGIANQSSRCAMCRQEIPSDFIDNPNLLKVEEDSNSADEYQWFYEGRNGWWQYDERTSLELEISYNEKQRWCEILVAGFLYTIDYELMIQQRRNDPNRRRRIKRDFSSVPKKGVAGLKQMASKEEFKTAPLVCADDVCPSQDIDGTTPDQSTTDEESEGVSQPMVGLSENEGRGMQSIYVGLEESSSLPSENYSLEASSTNRSNINLSEALEFLTINDVEEYNLPENTDDL